MRLLVASYACASTEAWYGATARIITTLLHNMIRKGIVLRPPYAVPGTVTPYRPTPALWHARYCYTVPATA
eukprot:3257992-Rhodomonas_salina.1